jgi:hypothetical protein
MSVHIFNQRHIDSLEDTMKPNTMFFAAVLMTALASPAPGQPAVNAGGKPAAAPVRFASDAVRRFEANYGACLTSANDGVVESAIAQCVRMKWALPSADLEQVRKALGTLATGGKSAAIRYKASLASLVYDAPSIFSDESGQKYAWDEDLFTAISERAQKAILGYTGGRPRGF